MAEKREIEIKIRSKGAESSADRLNKKVKGIGTSADAAERSMFNLSAAAAAVGAALATRQVFQYADAWTNVNNRLRAATKTNDEFITAQKGVIAIAQEAGVGLGGVADTYSRIAQNTEHLGLSQERTLDVTKKLTLAIKAGGATSQESASTLVQFGQGLGTNALQGEELKAIMEASIPVTKALAKEFGVSTGQLKKLGSEGKLTADRVVSAIENMDEKSLIFTKDITGGFTEVSNALTVYVGGVDESLGVTSALVGTMSSLAKNIDAVADVAITLAVILGGRLAGSAALHAKATGASAIASINSAKALTARAAALKAEAVELVKSTAAEGSKNKAVLLSAIAAKKSALSEAILTKSINKATLASLTDVKAIEKRVQSAAYSASIRVAVEERVIAANTASIASSLAVAKAELNLAAASTTLTTTKTAASAAVSKVAAAKTASALASSKLVIANREASASMVAMSFAAKGLSSALAFVGGPVGLAVIAAAGLYLFATSADEAGDKANYATDEIDKLTKAQTAVALRSISNIMNDLSDSAGDYGNKIASLNRKLDEGTKTTVTYSKLGKATIETVKLTAQEIDSLTASLEAEQAGLDGVNKRYKTQSDLLVQLSQKKNKSSGGEKKPDGKAPPVQSGKGAGVSFIDKLKLETDQYRAELVIREQLSQGNITLRQAQDAEELIGIAFNYEAKRESIISQEFQTAELRADAIAQINEQELLAYSEFEIKKSDIKTQAENDRLESERAYSAAATKMQQSVFLNAAGLLSSLTGEQKIAALAGIAIQTATALSANAAATAAGATLAFAAQQIPGDPTSLPRGLAAAGKATALGGLNAGLIVAGGLANAAGQFSGGGGGGSASGGGFSSQGGYAPVTPSPTATGQSQKTDRTINITGLEGFGPNDMIPITLVGLMELLETNEDVNVAINSGQQSASRVGAI